MSIKSRDFISFRCGHGNKGGGILSRWGIGRVSGVLEISCSSSLAESRPCAQRTRVDHRIGLKCPCGAPAPCCTLGRAVPSRQETAAEVHGAQLEYSLLRVVHLANVAQGGIQPIRNQRCVQQVHEEWQGAWQGFAGGRSGTACRTRRQLQR